MKTTHNLIGAFTLAALVAAGCGGGTAVAPDEGPPTLDVTNWTDRTELFMEYPVFVGGEPALFAIHLTRLDDFAPVTSGRVTVEFLPESGGSPMLFA